MFLVFNKLCFSKVTMSHVQNVRLLYKLVLKLHRGLPEELSVLGTKYARDEFRRHKTCPPEVAIIFMREWTNYAITLAKQLGAKDYNDKKQFGAELSGELLDNLRDEQLMQLYELMKASQAPRDNNT
ncbi:hypothetical protein ABEB36_006502 [Hypothenemus hampei]|uniref:Succinate dehydrogenase assembly factor 3 n=1 Tax=Hypothenemus hampei TaxID=57062 RepID=A0ABD1ERH3_HYPHA